MPRTRRPRPQDAIAKLDEKVVKRTDRTVPVEPPKTSRRAREPLAAPAVDRRRQIVGSGEPRHNKPGRRPK